MPHYKLTYFNIRARAEPIRIAFAYAGVEYEDIRITKDPAEKEWLPFKKTGKCPFGQIPILEVDGTTLAQARTILRYVAREVGLAPKDSLQLARAEMIIDKLNELENAKVCAILEPDQAKKEQLAKKFHEETLIQGLGELEKLAAANKPNVWFVGDKMSHADIDLFAFLNSYFVGGKLELPSQLQGYTRLSNLYNAVKEEPKIRAWLEKRPPSAI